MGAFVLPNKEIPDQADLKGFVMPGECRVPSVVGSGDAIPGDSPDSSPARELMDQSRWWSGPPVSSCSTRTSRPSRSSSARSRSARSLYAALTMRARRSGRSRWQL